MKKLILWDIDGTLILTGSAGMGALDAAFQKVHGRKPDLSRLDLSGRTDKWIAARVLESNDLPVTDDAIHHYLEAYLECLHAEVLARPGRVLPGILPLLELLHQRSDVVQGLLTGNLHRGARIKLEHYRVSHYFEFGAFADDSAIRNELGPHALRRAQDQHAMTFTPEHMWVIGDTPHDIECGQAIGAKTIGVATGRFSVAELLAHRPTAVFADFGDTAAFLRLIDGE